VIPPEGSDDILLHAIEIQKEGLENARSRLAAQLTPEQLSCIAWHHGSHETLPCDSESVRAVIYNLGYLPGGDKTRTTLCRSTLLSLTEACRVIAPGGLISVTCYPGHSEGAKELEALMAWTQNLSPQEWCATWHHLVNRNNAPTLLLLQKKLT
jgi:hypothetical protein